MPQMQDARARIDRNRQLALALQAQSLSTKPIAHRNQGLAQLVQAWVGAKANKNLDKEENKIKGDEARALAEAMRGPSVQVPGARPNQPGVAPGSPNEPASIFNRVPTGGPLFNQQQQGAMGALAPDTQRQLIAKKILHDSTLTPTAPAVRDAVNFGYKDGHPLAGHVADVAVPGTPKFNELVQNPDLVRIGPKAQLQQTKDVTDEFGDRGNEAQDLQISYRQAARGLDRLAETVLEAGDEALQFTGTVNTAVNSAWSQAKALARSATGSLRGRKRALVDGKLTAEIDGKVVSEGELFNPEHYADFFNGVQTINASNRQRITTQSLKLAYAMARADDPGGRLSDKDVEIQLRRLGLQQGDHRVTLAALHEVRKGFDEDTAIALDVMSGGEFNFQPEPLSSKLLPIFNDPSLSGGIPVSETYQIDGTTYTPTQLEGKTIVINGRYMTFSNGKPIDIGPAQ